LVAFDSDILKFARYHLCPFTHLSLWWEAAYSPDGLAAKGLMTNNRFQLGDPAQQRHGKRYRL